ncbi:hypothetical protein CK203_026435 [Vitis vinifera]|uniref:Uncharacterized protein n=1 Tax=Vitis vinifera TaxID=29760 RepID=A0A438IVV7_VITVI|nr:hypothetical protein CK203_026435 [Vitis vinifera]
MQGRSSSNSSEVELTPAKLDRLLKKHEQGMSTPSRSRSSIVGGEDYFVWSERMERCQQENDWQMQSLHRQMKRLKQANEELLAQMSTSGPFQSQHP